MFNEATFNVWVIQRQITYFSEGDYYLWLGKIWNNSAVAYLKIIIRNYPEETMDSQQSSSSNLVSSFVICKRRFSDED
jgi:hypothetical protein